MPSGLTSWGVYTPPLQAFIDSAEPSYRAARAAFLGKAQAPPADDSRPRPRYRGAVPRREPPVAAPVARPSEPRQVPRRAPGCAAFSGEDPVRADAVAAARKLGISKSLAERLAGTAPANTVEGVLLWIVQNYRNG